MVFKDQIQEKAREIRTDGYSMSIGEVLSLCGDGDIDIHPEFQRIFRWSESQKSRLIESILLGIPIPPIFVSQREDGVWDVIDGVQRLSTILEFTGNYKDESGEKRPAFQLEAGEYLSEMAGYSWGCEAEEPRGLEVRVFDDALKRDFKRAKLEFRIITKGSDINAKYDLFQRLNSGSVLSLQEVRNCLLVMLNRDMFSAVQQLSSSSAFTNTIQLSDRKEEQAYYDELVLRFFVQRAYEGLGVDLSLDYGEYITNWMREKAISGGLEDTDRDDFHLSFNLIEAALGGDAFRRWDGHRHLGPFSISSFEFVTSGVAANVEAWKSRTPEELAERVRQSWSEGGFRDVSGQGVSPRRRVPRLVTFGRKYFG